MIAVGARTALVGGILLAMPFSIAGAQAQPIGMEKQRLEVRRYTMPAGNFVTPAHTAQTAKALQEYARRHAKRATKVKRSKRAAGGPGARPTYVQEAPAAISPTAVLFTCQADGGGVPPFGLPPDITGGVNDNRILIASHQGIQVLRRTAGCPEVSNVPLLDFFDFPHTDTEEILHPRVIVDPHTGRMFVSAVSFDFQNDNQFQYLAVSNNRQLTDFNQFRVRLSQGTKRFCKSSVDSLWDPLTLGVSEDRLFITATDAPPGGDPTGAILNFDKDLLIQGGAGNDVVCVNQVDGKALPEGIVAPIVTDQSDRAFFPALLDNAEGDFTRIARYRLNITGGVGSDTVTVTPNINIPDVSPPPDAEQPNGQRLDTGNGQFSAPAYQQGNFFWAVHTFDDGGFAHPRLYKLPKTGTAPAFVFTPTTVLAGNDELFVPSVAVSNDRAYLNLTRTIQSKPAAGRAAHLVLRGPHSSADGWIANVVRTSPDQFDEPFPGVTCNNIGACRWGSYSSIMVDPSNPNRVWGFNELITGPTPGDWDGSLGQAQ